MIKKILKFIFKIFVYNGYAIYLGIALSVLGYGFRTPEFWIVTTPTIILVGLKFLWVFKGVNNEVERLKKRVQCLKSIVESEMNKEAKWK